MNFTTTPLQRGLHVQTRNQRLILYPVLVFFITRLLVFIIGWGAEVLLPTLAGEWVRHPALNTPLLDIWTRWDGMWYLRIISDGYYFQPHVQSSVAFFPLYPVAVNGLASILPQFGLDAAEKLILSGILISNACFLSALIFLYKLTLLEFNDVKTARRAVLYIAIAPPTFFFSAFYTESPFLLFTIASVYFARKRLWAWAGFWGLLASATRMNGLLILGVVGLEWLRVHGWTVFTAHRKEAWSNLFSGIRRDGIDLLYLGLIPLGLLTYVRLLAVHIQHPLAFLDVQSAWGRYPSNPVNVLWSDLQHVFGQNLSSWVWESEWLRLLNAVTAILVIVITIAIWRKLGAGYGLYTLISVLLPLSTSSMSMTRFAVVLFPVIMMLAWWGRNWKVDRAIRWSFLALLVILTAFFVNWTFVA